MSLGITWLHFKVADLIDLVSNGTTKQSWQYWHSCVVKKPYSGGSQTRWNCNNANIANVVCLWKPRLQSLTNTYLLPVTTQCGNERFQSCLSVCLSVHRGSPWDRTCWLVHSGITIQDLLASRLLALEWRSFLFCRRSCKDWVRGTVLWVPLR